MTGVFVRGCGAVSPAGWGLDAFRSALDLNRPLPVQELKAPDRTAPLSVRTVPAPKVPCSWGTVRCLNSQSAAATVIPGVVFSGTADGPASARICRICESTLASSVAQDGRACMAPTSLGEIITIS